MEFDRQMAEMKQRKEAETKRLRAERMAHLSQVVLLESTADFAAREITVKVLDDQLDVLRELHGFTDILKSHSGRGRKADKVKLLKDRLERLEANGSVTNAPTEGMCEEEVVLSNWEEDELETEME